MNWDLGPIITLTVITFALGVLLGFVGAGGAGLAVALLTGVFDVPVHEAIGTALAAMCFVTIAGSISHFREGNVAVGPGIVVGLAGMVGAVAGAALAQDVPESVLRTGAGLALWALAGLVWLRTWLADAGRLNTARPEAIVHPAKPGRDWAVSLGLGLSGGTAAAFFGVGMAPLLQLGFVTALGLPLQRGVGTTMLALIFISASGTITLARYGDVSAPHLVGLTIGLSAGSFVGARYTRRARREVLRAAVVAVPAVAGAILLFV